MAEFQTFNFVIHKKIEWMWLRICKALVTRYVPLILPQFFAPELFILVFWICAIRHKQLAAIIRGFMRFAFEALNWSAIQAEVIQSPVASPINFAEDM